MARNVERSALLVVDVQNDFCPGGALPVPEGDQVVPVLNEYIRRFRAAGRPVYLSRDWHPEKTRHFKQYGGQWPPHCVQGTWGAQFHPALEVPPDAIIISKGMDPEQDSYSCFQAYLPDGVEFAIDLQRRRIRHLYVGGLATDYCVKSSVLDAIRHGFKVSVLVDAIRGVNLNPGDSEKAIAEMVRAGAEMVTLEQVLPPPRPPEEVGALAGGPTVAHRHVPGEPCPECHTPARRDA